MRERVCEGVNVNVNKFSHIDDKNLPSMVDISAKKITQRTAHAQVQIEIPQEIAALFVGDREEITCKKGPVFQTSIIAGTQGAKLTSQLIPFCHQLPLEGCKIEIRREEDRLITIDCRVRTTGKTGVEMEALMGANIAALTFYDMCKSVSHGMVIKNLRLLGKTGGKSDIVEQDQDRDQDQSEETKAPPLYGLILAGGQSQRMKKDKGAIDYYGKSQTEYLYEILQKYCEKVFVSCREEQSEDQHIRDLPQIHDPLPNHRQGPMVGIHRAMEEYPHASWFVLACDLPFFDEKALKKLVEGRNTQKMATVYWNDKRNWPEPLCSLYEKTLSPTLQEFFSQGKFCPRKLLMKVEVQRIEPDDPNIFENINTPEDWQRAKQSLEFESKGIGQTESQENA